MSSTAATASASAEPAQTTVRRDADRNHPSDSEHTVMPETTPTEPTPSTETTDPTTTEPQGDPDGLGDAGKRAIEAERTARKQAEQQLRTLQEQFDAAAAKAAAFEAANTDLDTAAKTRDLELARYKVGLAKQLPPAWVERLRGDDQAALEADADALLALLPQAPAIPAAPRPDPSQGARTPAGTDPAAQFATTLQQAMRR